MTGEIIIFGLICLALVALAGAAVMTPLWRTPDEDTNPTTDIDIYREQLAEVERDLERGVLDAGEAERTRTEISRRLLSADTNTRAATGSAPHKASRVVAALVGLALLGGAGGAYWKLGALGYGDVPRAARILAGEERRLNRPTQAEAEAATPQPDAILAAEPETREILQALRAAAFERPNEVQGWAFLAQTEARVGNLQRAAAAQQRTIELLGDQAVVGDHIRLLDFLVLGTRGYVSPEAEAIALKVLQEVPDDPAALYYAGLMFAQNDRPDRAFGLWRQVVENSPQDSFHWSLAAGQIEDVALQLGMDYALPSRRGPSAEDIAAAENMSPEDRAQMIQGMVSGLADRLATEGGPPQDWARLISALATLGETDAATRILNEAEVLFGGDVQAVNIIRRAGQEAGLTE